MYFTFNGIVTSGRLKYQVTVQTRGPQDIHFAMEQKKEGWKIVEAPKLPDRVVKPELALERIIQEKLGTAIHHT